MAQSKSTSAKRVTKASTKKLFTLDEANRALPYVKRVVADIVDAHRDAANLQQVLSGQLEGGERAKTQTDFQRRIERLQELTGELTAAGVELKDYATGLIDFRGLHRGEEVYLCWRTGEENIAYFHTIEGGLASRRPIAELEEQTPVVAG